MNKQDKKEATRQRLLDAALKLFTSLGYHASTVPLIAREAGVATGTLYVHFRDKEALANELFRLWKVELMSAIDLGQKEEAPRQRFARMWHSYMAFALENPHVVRFVDQLHYATYLDEESRALSERLMAGKLAFIHELQQGQAVKQVPPPLLLALVQGLVLALLAAIEHGELSPTEELLAQAEGLCWEAVRA